MLTLTNSLADYQIDETTRIYICNTNWVAIFEQNALLHYARFPNDPVALDFLPMPDAALQMVYGDISVQPENIKELVKLYTYHLIIAATWQFKREETQIYEYLMLSYPTIDCANLQHHLRFVMEFYNFAYYIRHGGNISQNYFKDQQSAFFNVKTV